MQKTRSSHILITKMRYIGDTILITPLIKAIKEEIPHARIDVLVNKGTEEMLIYHHLIDKIWAFDRLKSKKKICYAPQLIIKMRQRKYNMAIDLTSNDRSSFFNFVTGAPVRIGFTSNNFLRNKLFYTQVINSNLDSIHTVDHHLKIAEFLNISIEDRHPFIEVPLEKKSEMDKILESYGLGKEDPFVVIHPGARYWYKSWPIENFARLADEIIRVFGIRVIFSGGIHDRECVKNIIKKMGENAIDLSGQISLVDLPALVKRAICLIGNDSSPIHIATAVKTPAIALFGPSFWEAWQPRRDHDQTLAAEFPCRPCGRNSQDCTMGDNYCMSSIKFEEVFDAVKKICSFPENF